MFEITVLGTSGSAPTRERSMPSVAVVRDGSLYLFDCGEGTQMQMLRYGINISRLKAIFISHVHGDHVIGIAGLVRSLALNNRREDLEIFVPAGSEKVVHSLVKFDNAMIDYRIIIKGVETGRVFSGRDFSVSAFKLDHTVKTCGYVISENDKIKFNKVKCRKLGIRGMMFPELLKKKKINVNGRIVGIRSVSRIEKGKRVVYATDTRPVRNTVNAARDADLLIHECAYEESEIALAKERKHSASVEVARLAKSSRVKMLVLTHFSARYKTTAKILKEARSIFMRTIAASDGYRIRI